MARRPKFRKGDKVRYLSGDDFWYTTGKIYEIEHVFFEKVEEENDNGEI